MAPVINLSVKFDTNIFIDDRYMAVLLLRRFGCEMLISAHFGEVFAFWRIDRANRSRNTTWALAEESKKKKKEK